MNFKTMLSIGIFFTIIYFNNSNAASFYCADTNGAIATGDSTDAVQAACGTPTSISTQTEAVTANNTVTQWIYAREGMALSPQGTYMPGLVPYLTITLQNDKVIQIQRNNTSVGGSISCSLSQAVGVNSTGEMILVACGKPTLVQTTQSPNNSTKEVTVWTYNRGPYEPQIILDFENNQLTQIISGQLGT